MPKMIHFPIQNWEEMQNSFCVLTPSMKVVHLAERVLYILQTFQRWGKSVHPISSEAGTVLHFRNFVCFWRDSPQWARASSFTRFLDHTQRRNTVRRTPLDGWSARRRDLWLTTHNTHNKQTSMPTVGFEPTISADERPQNYALDRAATGTGSERLWFI